MPVKMDVLQTAHIKFDIYFGLHFQKSLACTFFFQFGCRRQNLCCLDSLGGIPQDALPLTIRVLLQRSATENYLAIAISPIVADSNSAAAILCSLGAAYDAAVPRDAQNLQQSRGAPQPAIQPSIFMALEEKQQASEIWQEHRMYWASKLRGAACTLDLPRSVSRSKTVTGSVWSIPIEIPKNIWQQAHRVAANESTQPAAVLLAALQVIIILSGDDSTRLKVL